MTRRRIPTIAVTVVFGVFVLVMVCLVAYMQINVTSARQGFDAESKAITADLAARYSNEIHVKRTLTPDRIIETITVDGVETPDCRVVDTTIGWDLACDSDITLTPKETP